MDSSQLKTKSLLCIKRGRKWGCRMGGRGSETKLCVLQGCAFVLSFKAGREQQQFSFHRACFFLNKTAMLAWWRFPYLEQALFTGILSLPVLSFVDGLSISTVPLTLKWRYFQLQGRIFFSFSKVTQTMQ